MNQSIAKLDFCSKVIDFVVRGLYQEAFSVTKQLLLRDPSLTFHHQALVPVLPSLIKASLLSHSRYAGLQLHGFTIKAASIQDTVITNSLISLYSKSSDITSARKLFDEMSQRDTITWNSMVMGSVENGCLDEALELFKEMWARGYDMKPELAACVLSVCGQMGEVRLGRQIHGLNVVLGMILESLLLSTAMVNFYTKCCDLRSALCVFHQMKVRNEVSWTAMIDGCAANNEYEMALDCFRSMQTDGVAPNRVTLITILPACAELRIIKYGKEIHAYAFRQGFEPELSFSSALVRTYCQFRETSSTAIRLMERSQGRDIVMWGSIIGGFSRRGNITEAMRQVNCMQLEGLKLNSVILLEMVSACTTGTCMIRGQAMHCYALKSGLFSDASVGNSILNMYGKCGCPSNSRQIFEELKLQDLFSWSSLINAYSISGHGSEALKVFHEMRQSGVEADSVALLSTLSACCHSGLVSEGQRVFNDAIQGGNISVGIEHYACQIDLLAKAGKVDEAAELVRKMPMAPSAKIWSSLVSACKECGRLAVAESLACQLVRLDPDNPANYSSLSMVYANLDDWIRVAKVRSVMRVRGLRKNRGLSKSCA